MKASAEIEKIIGNVFSYFSGLQFYGARIRLLLIGERHCNTQNTMPDSASNIKFAVQTWNERIDGHNRAAIGRRSPFAGRRSADCM